MCQRIRSQVYVYAAEILSKYLWGGRSINSLLKKWNNWDSFHFSLVKVIWLISLRGKLARILGYSDRNLASDWLAQKMSYLNEMPTNLQGPGSILRRAGIRLDIKKETRLSGATREVEWICDKKELTVILCYLEPVWEPGTITGPAAGLWILG